MPLTGYSHHTDPKTGKTTLLPDLTGRGISYSHEQLLEWIKDGTIPEDMGKVLLEQMKRARNYESIHDELRKLGQEELKNKRLKENEAHDFLLANKGALLGSKILEDIFKRIKDTDPDIEWMATIKEAITSIASTDPLPIHFLTARTFLKEMHSIEAPEAVDLLTRKLVENCALIKTFKTFSHPVFIKHPIEPKDLNEHFEDKKRGLLSLDAELINYLTKLEKTGKEAAKQVEKTSLDLYSIYEKSNYASDHRLDVWSLWTPKANGISPFLSLLARVEWESSVAAIWNKQSKNPPALTQGVHPSVTKILSHKTHSKDIGDTVQLAHDTQIIATLPTIDPNLIKLVIKGVNNLPSIYHHKLIRFECKSGFENWASGIADPRVLRFKGGCSEISEKLGMKGNNKSIEAIKTLLHAQAHLKFNFDDGSCGNLIILNMFRSNSTGREEGIIITLGPQLLPHYTFQTTRHNRLLIPIPDLPPLIGSTNSHANQASLQMLVMQFFTNKSTELAETGAILMMAMMEQKCWNQTRIIAIRLDLPTLKNKSF